MLLVLSGQSPQSLPRTRRRHRTFRWLGAACRKENIRCVFTTPKDVKANRTVEGWEYDHAHVDTEPFRRLVIPFQGNIVYDAMYLDDLKQYKYTYARLRRWLTTWNGIVFNPILPRKDIVYRWLENGRIAIPETKYRVSIPDVIDMLENRKEVWFKPVIGSGGRNMLYIRKEATRRYFVQGDRYFGADVRGVKTQAELEGLVERGLNQRVFMAQQHIHLVTSKDGRPIDIRTTIQRNRRGSWQVVAVTGRMAAPDRRVTNFHAGGAVQSLSEANARGAEFLEGSRLDVRDLVKCTGEALRAGRVLGSINPRLGLLGIDIGIDHEGRTFVYDCNGRPGRDILTDVEIQRSMRYVAEFAGYLGDRYRTNGSI